MDERANAATEPTTPSVADERAYLLQRADAHRQLAENAGQAEPRLIHVVLQQLYEDRAAALGLVVSD